MPTLSDDEFMAQGPAFEKQVIEASLKANEPKAVESPPVETPPVETPPSSGATSEAPTTPAGETAPPSDPPAGEETTPPAAAATEPAGVTEGETPPTPTEPDYKGIYERLFGAPIRAGGQDITLSNPDEAISLIQKGVGFHSKMNRLHGDLKYVEMLRNNGLLDESKLSLLIDAQAGKPGAIKKLLDSAKVDPLTLDSAEASTYAPSDHRVSDEQMNFQSTVADLSASETGRTVLTDAQGWDQASKAEVYRNPDALNILAQQKEMGRYDLIVAEVKRGKLLGNIPATEPFLQSYTRVGQQMMQAGKFGATPPPPTPTPVAQKTVTPPAPANSKQAAAAAPTKASTPNGDKPLANLNEMSDDVAMAHIRKTLKI